MLIPWLRGPYAAEEPGEGPGGGGPIDPQAASIFDAPPPTPDPAPQPAPATQAIQIGDREFQVPTEMAEAFRNELENVSGMRGELQTTRTELDQMRQTWNRLQGVFSPEPQTPDLATQLYTDPNAAFQNLEDRIVTKVSNLNKQQQNQQQFWDDFYGQHEELRGFDDLVKSTLIERPDLYNKPDNAESRKELADAVRSKALQIAERFGGQGSGGATLRVVEGGNRGRRTAPAQAEPAADQPTTISEVLNKRRQTRRQTSA